MVIISILNDKNVFVIFFHHIMFAGKLFEVGGVAFQLLQFSGFIFNFFFVKYFIFFQLMHLPEIDGSVNEIIGIEKNDPHKENDQRKTVFVPQQRKKKPETIF